MSLVGDGVNLVIDYEMIKHKTDVNDTGEGELITAKRLLNSVVSAHKGMIDVIAYDALACNSIFINHCLELGVHSVIRVKNNNNLSIREIKRTTNKKDTIKQWVDGNYSIKAYESAFHMDGVVQPLRYVKFAKKHRDGSRSQVLIVTTAMNMSIKTIYRIMKSRWNIENRVFNNLKNNANLDHCFVHGGNAVEAVLYLMFIASNLFQLFKVRRIKNHISIQKELVRLLVKGLYLVRRNDIIVLNSS